LRIDQGDIETILYNLIHNALKFTPNNGVIKITWVKKQLSISDSGIGISKENIPHLFERFYKADLSRTNEGSGLGLTIVKEITDRYGAKITVSSNLGEGTTITVRFK
jgi:two-component system phosphate regulon sensor histidine kinase PhoR